MLESTNDDLSSKLSKDKDFITFCQKTSKFYTEVLATDSKPLFQKLANKTITENETTLLLSNLKVKTIEELKQKTAETFDLQKRILKKFPELATWPNAQSVIRKAVQHMGITTSKGTSSFNHPIEDCFFVLAMLNSCSLLFPTGSDEYNICWWTWIALLDFCIVTSD